MKDFYYVGDTETTGYDPADGERLIEICFIELDAQRQSTGREFHEFVDPEKEVPLGAFNVHGVSREQAIYLGGGQKFKDIAKKLAEFIAGGVLVTHNVAFDRKFLDAEFKTSMGQDLDDIVKNTFCTLEFARAKHPGQRNSLDALVKRYGIVAQNRELHGAKLDSDILIDVYLALTLEQKTLKFSENVKAQDTTKLAEYFPKIVELPVFESRIEEDEGHVKMMAKIDKSSGGENLWR